MQVQSAAGSATRKSGAGVVRRFWWRTSQSSRLAITCLGVLAGLATTGAVAFDDGITPEQRRRADASPTSLSIDPVEVTVHSVSDVDSFEGLETATGKFVRAKVAGLRRATACQETESLTTAENFLRGKKVRLSIRETSSPASDRMFVDVLLPDGKDYAQNIVQDGAALADSATRGELTATESAARQERRGLWSAPCAPNDPNPTVSISASSTTATSASTGTASATPPPLSQSPHPPRTPPAATTTPAPQPPADDVQAGKPCSPEGARGKTSKGDDVVCIRNGKNELRWRKP